MVQRCTNANNHVFKHYGARGIKVCPEWLRFDNFLSDMGERPKGKTIDRIDNSKGYDPGNCRWATQSEQMRNTRSNRLLNFRGSILRLSEVAAIIGMREKTLRRRIDQYGMSVEEAVALPVIKGMRVEYARIARS